MWHPWKVRKVGFGAVVVAVVGLACSACVTSADPDGQVMDQLVSATFAVPGYGTSALPIRSDVPTSGPYLTKIEPYAVCPPHGGSHWSQVEVQAGFAWSGPPPALVARMNSAFIRHGWAHKPPSPDTTSQESAWTKGLSDGTSAQAKLIPDGVPGRQWKLIATAPPIADSSPC